METHAHHLHKAPGKKWMHYFFEFFMLFLAVFCGFLAENIREHKVEKDREKQFIRSLVEDLGGDTMILAQAVNDLYANVKRMDTLMKLLTSREVKDHGSDLYHLGRRASRGEILALHDWTIQQMKNSGGFRLIRNQKASKAIIEYYNRVNFIDILNKTGLDESDDYRKLAIDVFHPILFDSIVMPDNVIVRPAYNPALLTYDPVILLRLAGKVSYIKNTRLALAIQEEAMKQAAKELILLLRKEYHLNE